ncbi:MAG: hypothetical protein A4E73_03124 [Syntrophaceae bacterium PtaU1.Bin231]|nr:MAG: hypothetical protein A4E73_03124 [Syntrophaceae bacterium PtaU1.Bin231]
MDKPSLQLNSLVDMTDHQAALSEVVQTLSMTWPSFDFAYLRRVFADMEHLFSGRYPGYQACNTRYHDFRHTLDVFLAMARLLHGASVAGLRFTDKQAALGVISALMHDTGYIQTTGDRLGTGAKYTAAHVDRSIVFMKRYYAGDDLFEKELPAFDHILHCTGFTMKIPGMRFPSRELELLGKMLGTADLLGQMADRLYLEKLLFLYYEFVEAGISDYESELDLLKKTVPFYQFIRRRFAADLEGVDNYMIHHFRARWNIDRDLYREAVEQNLRRLQFILDSDPGHYRSHLRRNGITKSLQASTVPPESPEPAVTDRRGERASG